MPRDWPIYNYPDLGVILSGPPAEMSLDFLKVGKPRVGGSARDTSPAAGSGCRQACGQGRLPAVHVFAGPGTKRRRRRWWHSSSAAVVFCLLALLHQPLVVLLNLGLLVEHSFSRLLLLLPLLYVLAGRMPRLHHAARGRGLPVVPGPQRIRALGSLLSKPIEKKFILCICYKRRRMIMK